MLIYVYTYSVLPYHLSCANVSDYSVRGPTAVVPLTRYGDFS